MKAYSTDLRIKIVEAYNVQKLGSQREIARIFNVRASTVQKYLKLHKENKSLEPKYGGGNPAKVQGKNIKVLTRLQLENPDITLKELGVLLEAETGIVASEAVLCKTLKRLGITRKKNKTSRTAKHRKSSKRKS